VRLCIRTVLPARGELRHQDSPAEPDLPCSCGGQARDESVYSKPLLTVFRAQTPLPFVLGHVSLRTGPAIPGKKRICAIGGMPRSAIIIRSVG
jgi:hypothetical protein